MLTTIHVLIGIALIVSGIYLSKAQVTEYEFNRLFYRVFGAMIALWLGGAFIIGEALWLK